jgi:LysM repeat protein
MARKYDVTVARIKAVNALPSNQLHAGKQSVP